MVQERDFKEYLRALRELLTDHFEGKFYFSVGSDVQAARTLFSLQVPPEEVLSCLVNYGQELIERRFNLFQVAQLVKENVKEKTSTPQPQVPTLSRVELLIDFTGSLLSKLNLPAGKILGRLKELLDEEDPLTLERELIKVEGELFNLLESTPQGKECREEARRKLEKYSFYWDSKVLELTQKALVKECLRRRYGVPEFTSVPT